MGGSTSKIERYAWEKEVGSLKEKVRLLREEIKEMMCVREEEIRSNERDMMVFAFKEAEWKQEKKRLKEEVKSLRKIVEEKEERIREMKLEGGLIVGENSESTEWELVGTKLLMVQMEEERARRDEAVDKWKQLYLEIKNELDDLLQRTYHGEALYWRSEEEDMLMEKLQRGLEEKEETIKVLEARLTSTEHEKCKKEREFDLLRQSLRIMNKKSSFPVKEKPVAKFTFIKQTKNK